MFKQRLLTTLILVPLVLMAIYYANFWTLGGLVLLVTVLLGWEWLQLIPLRSAVVKGLFVLLLIGLIWPAYYWLSYWLIASFVFWVFILLAVLTFPASQSVWGHRFVVALASLLLLPLLPVTITGLYHQAQGKNLIVYLLCLIWATDIGAYLAGKQWGRLKLIPAVSPGKTVEGFIGGLCLAVLVAILGYLYFKPSASIVWFLMAISTAFIATVGDLFISMLKRRVCVKDTGHLFPGHGGVLDRLDSLIAALPLFYFLQTVYTATFVSG